MANEIQNYMGPYEEWAFKNGLGYSFSTAGGIEGKAPFMAGLAEYKQETGFASYAIMAEGDAGNLVTVTPVLPPVWQAENQRFMPFIFANPKTDNAYPQATGGYGVRESLAPRFKLNFGLQDDRVHTHFKKSTSAGSLSAPRWKKKEHLKQKRLSIIGIIDDGIPFANSRFLDSTGATRIEHFWALSAKADNANAPSVPFGREFTCDDIDSLRSQFSDEDVIYREAGLIGPGTSEKRPNLNRAATHGSIVMDILAGNSTKSNQTESPELGDEVRVIAVQVPNTAGWDTSGFGQDMYILSAFHYIFERAKRIAEAYQADSNDDELPLVINFSYGFSGGAHNGSTELESAIGDLVRARRQKAPTALVMPSGNLFEERMHGVIEPLDMKDGTFEFQWKLQPNDRTPSFLELWFPENVAGGDYEVSISGPAEPLKAPAPGANAVVVGHDPAKTGGDPRRVNVVQNHLGKNAGQISADKFRDQRWRVVIAMGPTEPENIDLEKIQAGKWTVKITARSNTAELTEPVLCWIQRDSDPLDRGSGNRQSYLYDSIVEGEDPVPRPRIDHPDAFIRRFGSHNGTATDSQVTLVAGFDAHTKKPASYSSAGSVDLSGNAIPNTKQVGISAASERSPTLGGIVGSGIRSGSVAALSGTSAASPKVARELARAFSQKTPGEIKAAEPENYVSLVANTTIEENEYWYRARLSEKAIDCRFSGSVDLTS